MWKIESTQKSVVRKCTKLVINMGMTVMVQIIETINRLFGKLTRPHLQSARAMHRPLLAESFMAIHRPLLAESFMAIHRPLLAGSFEVMHRPPFKAKKGMSTRKPNFNKMHPRSQVQGNVCQHAKIRNSTVKSQNKGRPNIFQNGPIQDKGKIKNSSNTT